MGLTRQEWRNFKLGAEVYMDEYLGGLSAPKIVPFKDSVFALTIIEQLLEKAEDQRLLCTDYLIETKDLVCSLNEKTKEIFLIDVTTDEQYKLKFASYKLLCQLIKAPKKSLNTLIGKNEFRLFEETLNGYLRMSEKTLFLKTKIYPDEDFPIVRTIYSETHKDSRIFYEEILRILHLYLSQYSTNGLAFKVWEYYFDYDILYLNFIYPSPSNTFEYPGFTISFSETGFGGLLLDYSVTNSKPLGTISFNQTYLGGKRKSETRLANFAIDLCEFLNSFFSLVEDYNQKLRRLKDLKAESFITRQRRYSDNGFLFDTRHKLFLNTKKDFVASYYTVSAYEFLLRMSERARALRITDLLALNRCIGREVLLVYQNMPNVVHRLTTVKGTYEPYTPMEVDYLDKNFIEGVN